MAIDLSHQWGGDLDIGSTGDLATGTSPVISQQRILRRLLTNPGDYIWNIGYGAGLPTFVGETTAQAQIAAVIRSEMLMESSVSHSPEPSVDVIAPDPSQPGVFSATIYYQEATTGQVNSVIVPISD